MKAESGFTLVEALVTGVLSTIVAGTLVSVLGMVNQQINAGIAENRLGRIQTTVSEQIRASVRKSWGILQSGEIIDDTHHYSDLGAVAGSREIIVSDKDGNTMAKYLIDNSGAVMEWHEGDPGDYYPFRIGTEAVQVDASKSGFTLAAGRKSMTFKLAYVLAGKSLPIIQEAIQCRNLSN